MKKRIIVLVVTMTLIISAMTLVANAGCVKAATLTNIETHTYSNQGVWLKTEFNCNCHNPGTNSHPSVYYNDYSYANRWHYHQGNLPKIFVTTTGPTKTVMTVSPYYTFYQWKHVGYYEDYLLCMANV